MKLYIRFLYKKDNFPKAHPNHITQQHPLKTVYPHKNKEVSNNIHMVTLA